MNLKLNIAGEIAGLWLKHRSLDRTRREALNKILDIKGSWSWLALSCVSFIYVYNCYELEELIAGSIRVFCRVRPVLSTDRKRIHQPISTELEKVVVRSGGSRKEFSFDKVFPQEASQGKYQISHLFF